LKKDLSQKELLASGLRDINPKSIGWNVKILSVKRFFPSVQNAIDRELEFSAVLNAVVRNGKEKITQDGGVAFPNCGNRYSLPTEISFSNRLRKNNVIIVALENTKNVLKFIISSHSKKLQLNLKSKQITLLIN